MAARRAQIAGYIAVVAACFALGMLAGWNRMAGRVDNQAYDRQSNPPPATPSEAVVLAMDEATLRANGERDQIRNTIAATLETIRDVQPKAVALDVILGGYADRVQDDRLEAALRATPNLVLGSLVDSEGKWEDPAPRFKAAAAAVGHVHYESDQSDYDAGQSDGVARQLALETVYAGERRWAMALEAFRVAHNAEILESPDDIEVAHIRIPAARHEATRPMFIRYEEVGTIPQISISKLDQHLEELRGKTIFLGVTSLSAANDRLRIPSGETIPGVSAHAYAYETIRRGRFLTDASSSTIFAICVALATGAAIIFALLAGWPAYISMLPLLILPLYLPRIFFGYDIVFPIVAPTAVAWLCTAGAATYQHFVIRGSLRKSESDKARYQQAIHWAAHEMRTPLTAIQGSSEIMTRYKLPEEKRNEMSAMINSESKRLSRIIQTFLDVERIGAGEMELKKEVFPAAVLVDTCIARVAPIAERKNIELTLDTPVDGTLTGDRELMEYAFYNLLTNAVKYSPADTHIRVLATKKGPELRLAVQDEGIGMDSKELKSIFKKFYRTKKAEESGEAGTGIGLSIVQQIVTHHGGKIDVTSIPGKGSCFTIVMSAQ
ncbi:MAG: CHASE2 domain-containing protein [Bryobacteraceae bacterium]